MSGDTGDGHHHEEEDAAAAAEQQKQIRELQEDALRSKVAEKGKNITGKDLLQLSIYNYGRSQNDEHFLILVKSTRSSLYFQIDNWDQPGLQFSLNIFGNDLWSHDKGQAYMFKVIGLVPVF